MSKLTRMTPANDPQFRVDILLLKLGEAAANWAERKAFTKFGIPLNLWDGNDGLRSVLETKIQELEIDEPLSVAMLARKTGLIAAKPKRIRKAS